MKKKFLALLLVIACVISCSACTGKEENETDDNTQKEANAVGIEITDDTNTKATEDTETNKTEPEEINKAELEEADKSEEPNDEEYEYPSEDAGTVAWESPLGYSMPYDPTVFTLDDTAESDVFTYNTAEKLDAPVYISVQPYPNMDIQTLAEGVALQSGIDGVEPSDAFFGANGIESRSVYIENEVDGVKQIQVIYAIPVGKGSLLMEIGSYAGVPQKIDGMIEEMLGNFTLTAE